MYGLPESGILANKLLKKRLEEHEYTEVYHTPGLFKNENRPIWFTLTVDDFGVKYIGEEHAIHLMDVLKLYYKTEEDWKGHIYCGITLNWNYDKGTLKSPCLTMLPINSPNTDTSHTNANNISHMNQIQSDMERILTTSYMKKSPHPSMTMTRNSSNKY